MAAHAVCDTTVLYAAGNRNAQRHETGFAIVVAADSGDLPVLRIPGAVLIETMNGLTRDVGHETAVELLQRLHAGSQFDLIREPKTVWERALDLFRQVVRLSLADALIVAGMCHHDIEYCYTFDDDFDGFNDVNRLATADNPFEP
jgi:predicted nucleic acid-binding protein